MKRRNLDERRKKEGREKESLDEVIRMVGKVTRVRQSWAGEKVGRGEGRGEGRREKRD